MTGSMSMPYGSGIFCAGVRITFFERSNATDESVEGLAARMVFSGHFAINDSMIQFEDGALVEAGLGADFEDGEGPSRAWVWFSSPVEGMVKEAFERFFTAQFAEDGMRMEIDPEVFLKFAESNDWSAFAEDDEDFE